MVWRLFTFILLICPCCHAEEPNARRSIVFRGEAFELFSVDVDEHGLVRNLYTQAGKAEENWTKQVAVCEWTHVDKLAKVTGPTLDVLQPRYVRDANVFSREGDVTSDRVLIEVFLTSDDHAFFEYQLLWFVQGEGTAGVKLYLYAERFPQSPDAQFPNDQARTAAMNELAGMRVDVVTDSRTYGNSEAGIKPRSQ